MEEKQSVSSGSVASSMVAQIAALQDYDRYSDLAWEGSFEQYLQIVRERPQVTRNAFQRVYDMVISYGTEEYIDNKKKLVRYNFFRDEIDEGKDAVFGLDIPLMRLMNVLKAASEGYGPERRVILLHGPVGSSKSTIARLLKKGLERYSATPEGALYTFRWVNLASTGLASGGADTFDSPMHEEPLRLVPLEWRDQVYRLGLSNEKFGVNVEGDLDPASRFIFSGLMQRYQGDWGKVVEKHLRVRRLLLSEKDRVGIGTFQPKDEKNQDATELTGDINYRKIAEYGSDSDPRAFNFDGEFNVANRGIVEFIEILKLDVAFLYDLLGASQEHKIKPKKFPQTDIDEVVLGHTNAPEYRKLQNNELMEAFRDRTVKIDVPYNTVWQDEVKIYSRDFNERQITGKHIAPHTIEMSAMWAVLTRLEAPKKAQITLMQKLKLYGGKSLPGFTEDNVKEFREEWPREGMDGISPRYIQDKISNAIVRDDTGTCVNPFMVLNELESGLHHHSLITREEIRKRYRELLSMVKQEYEDVVKNEVQKAISADEEAIGRLCGNYVDNIKAYTFREKVRNKFTGQEDDPDERLMRSIEEKIDISESRKDDFRREIMNYIAALALEGKQFDYRTNERLQKALELKLFEDQKDSIKLTSLVSSVVDKDTQEKIDIVKTRLIKDFGYDEISATDVLNYVASIFARGDSKQR